MSKNLSTDSMISTGILIIRVGLGIMFILHGAPKLLGGESVWIKVGSAVSRIGIHNYFAVWGLLAGLTEFAGGLLLLLGMFQRIVCLFLLVVMCVAVMKHYSAGEGFKGYSHALEAAIVFLGLIFTGPGKYSIYGITIKRKPKY